MREGPDERKTIMIDINEEQVIPAVDVPKHLPSRPSQRTVFRWMLDGYGKDRIRLESIKIGNARFTSVEAIGRFLAAVNQPPSPRQKKDRRRQIAEADRRLSQDGL